METKSMGDKLEKFELSLGDVSVELSNLGASITKLYLPSSQTIHESTNKKNDCVLGYDQVEEMKKSKNPVFFSSIVGRVANRIQNAKLILSNQKNQTNKYSLDANDGSNHLHGGIEGFSHKLWHGKNILINDKMKAVEFTLISHDDDQGYPGSIHVSATYSLIESHLMNHKISLQLQMKAKLLSQDLSTPINLAQHSYFNLACHNHPNGILDHNLILYANHYTPTDSNGIPTKEVIHVSKDSIFDFRPPGKRLDDALYQYATQKAGCSLSINLYQLRKMGAFVQDTSQRSTLLKPGMPFGYDHNFCIDRNPSNQDDVTGLYKVATLKYMDRKMTVLTDAPGVQVYTGNFLNDDLMNCKDKYHQWQSICLETQAYPDSIDIDEASDYDDFRKGSCFILHPGGDDYMHNVQYHF